VSWDAACFSFSKPREELLSAATLNTCVESLQDEDLTKPLPFVGDVFFLLKIEEIFILTDHRHIDSGSTKEDICSYDCRWLLNPAIEYRQGRVGHDNRRVWRFPLIFHELSWCYGPRLVGLSVLVSGTPWPNFIFPFLLPDKLLCSSSWGALSDERTDLQFVVQSVSGESSGGLITIYTSITVSSETTKLPLCRSYKSQGLRWKYSNPPPHGATC
jgi:hypothetical protein